MPTLEPIAAEHWSSRGPARPQYQERSYLTRWIFPELALAAAVVTLIWMMVFFGGPSALFRDADAGWHIRAGERILATGALPAIDAFSFSRPGAAWMEWEWGSDVITAAAHRMYGLTGVAFLYSLAIAASVWMWFRLNWAAGGNFLLACLFAAPMLSTTNLHWLARPHVFSWLFLIGTVWFCECGGGAFASAFVLSALWANLHGSFFLGPEIAFLYAAGAWLRPRIWDCDAASARPWLLAGLAASAGTLLNPNGWHLHQHVLAYLSDSALLDRIGEFQSFNFHAAGAAQIVLALLIGFAGGLAALSARRPERFLLSVLLTCGALRSARLLPVAALILLPLANGSITTVLTKAKLASRLREALDHALGYTSRLRTIDRTLGGYATIPIFAFTLFALISASHPAFPADQFPVAASNTIARLPGVARIFASDKFGGYLIYRFNGERKVFFDGRSDFYGADFLKSYSRMVQARPRWHDEFARWHFTHALLPPDYSLLPSLEARGWMEIYRDGTAVLLESPKA